MAAAIEEMIFKFHLILIKLKKSYVASDYHIGWHSILMTKCTFSEQCVHLKNSFIIPCLDYIYWYNFMPVESNNKDWGLPSINHFSFLNYFLSYYINASVSWCFENLKTWFFTTPLHRSQPYHGKGAWVTQWSYKPCYAGPPKTDGS